MAEPIDDSEPHSRRAGDPDLRFSLANERTFLAWGRTALTMIATGLLVARLLPRDDPGGLEVFFGGGLIAFGTAMGVWAYATYRRTDSAIRKDEPAPQSPLPIVLLLAIVFAGALAILISGR